MKYALPLILVVFATLGVIYSVVTPPFEAIDESSHYPMVRTIAEHWDLPVQDLENLGPWWQEGNQPPLYYALMAAATFWIDTSDIDVVRHVNPHVDIGVVTADGNVNMVVHRPTGEMFPWGGTVLAVHLIRLLSIGMGATTVTLTYLLVCELFPGQQALALGAAAINAFTPMFVFVSSAVNNDNLAMLLCSLALLLIAKIAKVQTLRFWPLTVGVALGLAALTKLNGLGLFPLALLVVSIRAWGQYPEASFPRRLGSVLLHLTLVGLPALAIAGWWYWRNWRLYGDPLGLNVFLAILGRRVVPADLAQLWRERYSFLTSYWGHFGHVNVPMPSWTYAVLDAVLLIAGLGLIAVPIRLIIRKSRPGDPQFRISDLLSCAMSHLSLGIVLLWPVVVFASWIRWASITYGSQGRLVFPAISVWSLLLALGLRGCLPRDWGRWAMVAFAGFLLVLAAAAPFAWIRPTYVLPEPLTDAQIAAIPNQQQVDFGGTMRLLGYHLETATVRPGGQVGVRLYWEALAPADRDYTVFVHLLGEGELVVAQRDTFPGVGQLSTTWLEPGYRWADRYVLRVPDTAYTPDVAEVEVGLYDATTGARLLAAGPGGELWGDNLRFGSVEIPARLEGIPNPISVNFGDQMALEGYDLSERVIRSGDEITVTLYWQGLRPMQNDYTISVQLVDELHRKAGQLDNWPQEGAAPTTSWETGQMITDARALMTDPGAPAGVYDVWVVVYRLEEGEFVYLPVIPEGGLMLSEHVALARVRVGP